VLLEDSYRHNRGPLRRQLATGAALRAPHNKVRTLQGSSTPSSLTVIIFLPAVLTLVLIWFYAGNERWQEEGHQQERRRP
jgi:hypothetical protein